MCDATSDISHTEQNVVLIRYVKCNKVNNWEINERFFEFKSFFEKTGSEIAEMIENLLHDKGIDIWDCRGQGYDNGVNMSGKVKGVQAQILKKNNLATFSPCATHTLNLVSVHAAESSPEVATFFLAASSRIYAFVSTSTKRWTTYKEKAGCSLHRLSNTR